MIEFLKVEKIEAIKQEIRMRRKVYPRLVEQKKMTEAMAARKTAVMEAILRDYE